MCAGCIVSCGRRELFQFLAFGGQWGKLPETPDNSQEMSAQAQCTDQNIDAKTFRIGRGSVRASKVILLPQGGSERIGELNRTEFSVLAGRLQCEGEPDGDSG